MTLLDRLRARFGLRERGLPTAVLGDLPDPRLALSETAENVEALLGELRELLAAEESRDQSFNARGVGLAGFVGIIVSLSTTLGRDALRADLADAWQVVATALFGAALVLLLASVIVVVLGVLGPKQSAHLSYAEVSRYASPERIYQHKVMSQGRSMQWHIGVLGIERERAGKKARWLRWGYGTLIGGLVCIASLGFILGLNDAGVIPDDGSKAIEYRLCATPAGGAPAAALPVTVRIACP
jgi:hypothetical protein